MVAEVFHPGGRSSVKAHLPSELERALRNCGAALQSLGTAEARIRCQLAQVQADRALLTRKPFAPLSARSDPSDPA